MKVAHCSTCGTTRPFKRALGFGTLFAVMLTGGLWLVLIPFYPIRCTQCGTQWRPKSGQFSWR